MRIILISVLLLGTVLTATAQQKANYELAEKFRNLSFGHLSKFSLDMYPRYINNSDRFWFDFTTEAGILAYLNGREFAVQDVWFLPEFAAMPVYPGEGSIAEFGNIFVVKLQEDPPR